MFTIIHAPRPPAPGFPDPNVTTLPRAATLPGIATALPCPSKQNPSYQGTSRQMRNVPLPPAPIRGGDGPSPLSPLPVRPETPDPASQSSLNQGKSCFIKANTKFPERARPRAQQRPNRPTASPCPNSPRSRPRNPRPGSRDPFPSRPIKANRALSRQMPFFETTCMLANQAAGLDGPSDEYRNVCQEEILSWGRGQR